MQVTDRASVESRAESSVMLCGTADPNRVLLGMAIQGAGQKDSSSTTCVPDLFAREPLELEIELSCSVIFESTPR